MRHSGTYCSGALSQSLTHAARLDDRAVALETQLQELTFQARAGLPFYWGCFANWIFGWKLCSVISGTAAPAQDRGFFSMLPWRLLAERVPRTCCLLIAQPCFLASLVSGAPFGSFVEVRQLADATIAFEESLHGWAAL